MYITKRIAARLHARATVADRDRPDRDAEVEVAGEVDVADRARIDVAARRLEIGMICIARIFGAPDTVPGGKTGDERIEVIAVVGESAVDGGHEVHDMRVALERHVLRHPDRCRTRRRARGRCARGPRASRARRVPSRCASAPRRAADPLPRSAPRGRVPAIGCVSTRGPSTRTSISGDDPTMASAAHPHEIHVGRRVDVPQRAIHGERIGRRRPPRTAATGPPGRCRRRRCAP